MAKKKKVGNGGPPTVQAKFVGRYTVVRPCDPTKSSEVRIFAPKLDHPEIRLLAHAVSLTMDSQYVVSGMETAMRAIPFNDGTSLRELLIWNIAGCDVEFLGYDDGTPLSVTLPDQSKPTNAAVPDLTKLTTGNYTIDPELLQYNMPPTKPVAARVNLVGGSVTCDYEGFGVPNQMKAGKSAPPKSDPYVFGAANDHSRVVVGIPNGVGLADTITWTIGCDENFAIRLRMFDGTGAHTIRCTAEYNTIPFIISNTCAAGVQINRDHEFAAYYDLLSAHVAWGDRMVPVLASGAKGYKLHPTCDGTDHCSGSSQVAI